MLIVPALLPAQPATQTQDRDKAALDGHVLNSATGEPLRKARLVLRATPARPANAQRQQPQAPLLPPVVAASDNTGHFEFLNVDPGEYQITVSHPGFENLTLGATGEKKKEAIVLAPGDRKSEMVVKLVPYGAIAGRLVDEDGDPIQGLQVMAMTYRYTSKGRELVQRNQTSTNDLGEFRIFNLAAARYYLKAGPPQMRMNQAAEDTETFYPLFFPGVTDPAGATALELTPGQQIRDLSIPMRKIRLATIRGRVVAPAGASMSIGMMIISSEGGTSTSTRNVDDKEGKFVFYGVPPGQIYLVASYAAEGQRFSAQVPLQIASSDITGVELRPLAPMEITGQVRIDGPAPGKLSDVRVGLQGPGRSYGNDSGNGALRDDGALAFHGVEPNSYRVVINRAPNMYLKSAHWGTLDVTDSEIDLTNGFPPRTELSVILGADCGQLTGKVNDDSGQPADSATVTLVPTGAHRSRSFFKSATTDATGQFTIKNIAPGSYKLYAWDKVDTNAVMYDPDFLRPYEPVGQTVAVESNGKHTADLKLLINKEAH